VKKIVSVLSFSSYPTPPLAGLRDETQKNGKLLDATGGKKIRTIIITSSDHITLSAIAAETLHQRLESSIKRES